MKNYWSCSKFADWVRGTPKLSSGTAEEWNTWGKKAKTNHIRYWIVEEGFDYLQDFLFWPVNRFADIRHYINNRWISKTHALTSNLKRGQYYEFETRLLHSLFDELANFVEIEQAWMHAACSDEVWQKYKKPWYRNFSSLGRWRAPEAGLAYLEWAAGLKHDEEWVNPNHPNYGKPTQQALAAQEIIYLYNWWKEQRPKRPDPMGASGLSEYYEERRLKAKAQGDDDLMWISGNREESDMLRWNQLSDVCNQMEKEQEDEDTEMLIRLIRLRRYLWT